MKNIEYMEYILLFIDSILGAKITAQLEFDEQIDNEFSTDYVFNNGATIETVTVREHDEDGQLELVE